MEGRLKAWRKIYKTEQRMRKYVGIRSLVILAEPGRVFPQVRKYGRKRKRQRRSKGKKQCKMQEVEK